MPITVSVASRRLTLRRADRCARCDAELPAGVTARWDSTRRTVTCLLCAEPGQAPDRAAVSNVDSGVAGASLAREHAQRRGSRERRVRAAHPHIGGLLLALSTPPQHEEAFRIGEAGEIAVGAALQKAVGQVDGVVLHNRRRPGGHGDIDHIAIVPGGIYVIDAKAVKGRVEIHHPWFRAPELRIAGCDRTKYLDGLDRQTQAVRVAIATTDHATVPVQGALCFTHADLPFWRTIEIRDHLLIYRKALTRRLLAAGPLDPARIQQLALILDRDLRPA